MLPNVKIIHITNSKNMADRSIMPINNFLIKNGFDSEILITKNILIIFFKLLSNRDKIIHCHACNSSTIPLFISWLLRIKTRIYHNHGMPYIGHKGVKRLILRYIERWNIFFSNKMICVSQGNIDYAINDKLLKKDYCNIFNNGSACGIIQRKFSFNDRDIIVFGYISRKVTRKGYKLIIDSWKRSRLSEHGHWLFIAGFTIKKKIKGIVSFGYIYNIEDFIKLCDIICLPSYHEGLPNVLLEGASLGKPLIGLDIPGINDVICNEFNGLLIKKPYLANLSIAFEYFAKFPKIRYLYGRNAFIYLPNKFNRNKILNKYIEFYRAVQVI